MRTLNFAKRNFKEIIRDPLSIIFAVILPLFLLFIFQQFDIPTDNYKIENFTPGIIIFSFSFITLFTAMLISKDRSTSLLIRLGISPMKPMDYIFGYIISIILGLNFSINIIWAALISIVIAVLFIAIGILIGSIFSEKASSGISSIVVQLVCFTSGMYFSKDMLGDIFSKVCDYLPFDSCVTIIKGVMNNKLDLISIRNILVFIVYLLVTLVVSIIVFRKKMISDNE